MKKCAHCHKPIPLAKTYCGRYCAAQGWKAQHGAFGGKTSETERVERVAEFVSGRHRRRRPGK